MNDDSVKLYKGIDGKTMIISIESNSIKPYNFPGVGIVNEINMSFKEIAPVSNYSIYITKG